VQSIALRNRDGTFVPANPALPVLINTSGQCAQNCWNIPLPFQQLVTPGGDFSANGNLEYRITIAGPVALAPFVDLGTAAIIRTSQLQIAQLQYDQLLSTFFGCPALPPPYDNCQGGSRQTFSQFLHPVPGTNWVPRMSTGLELQMMLPVINAPFRIYWAYNALRLNSSTTPPVPITRSMFPAGAAGDYTFSLAQSTLGPNYTLREPRKTFRFSVATTF
jgi:outer membrane protein insertion porin family